MKRLSCGDPGSVILIPPEYSCGRIAGICHKSIIITGDIPEWERWTEMVFPETGDYVVSKALTPISIDKDKNVGTYVEPNVWMIHELKRQPASDVE